MKSERSFALRWWHSALLIVAACSCRQISADGITFEVQDEVCQTSDGFDGVCIPLMNCTRIYASLKVTSFCSSSVEIVIPELRKCGSTPPRLLEDGKANKNNVRRLLMCCRNKPRRRPLAPTSTTTTSTTPRPPAREPPSWLREHAALRWLPAGRECQHFGSLVFGGRTPSRRNSHPWIARIGSGSRGNDTVKFNCGGSLISNRHVLTAAHCLKEEDAIATQNMVVRLGEFDVRVEEGEVDRRVRRAIKHSSYRGYPHHNDIALIELDENVTYTGSIRPICLPIQPEVYGMRMERKTFTVAGWGLLDPRLTPDTLQEAKVEGRDFDECAQAEAFKMLELDRQRQMCAAGPNGTDTCKGDSGGPLEYENDGRWIVAGVVSLGANECGQDRLPGVYTIVAPYMHWLLDSMVQ